MLTPRGATLPGKAGLVDKPGYSVKTVGVAGNDDQTQTWKLHAQTLKDFQNYLFFRFLRAAGQPHNVIARKTRHRGKSPCSRVVAVGLRAVEFHRAGYVHGLRPGANLPETLGINIVLHGD